MTDDQLEYLAEVYHQACVTYRARKIALYTESGKTPEISSLQCPPAVWLHAVVRAVRRGLPSEVMGPDSFVETCAAQIIPGEPGFDDIAGVDFEDGFCDLVKLARKVKAQQREEP